MKNFIQNGTTLTLLAPYDVAAGDAFELRCEIREQLIAFLQREYPTALPRAREESLRPEPQQDVPDERPARTLAR